jgi:hypothetical protein
MERTMTVCFDTVYADAWWADAESVAYAAAESHAGNCIPEQSTIFGDFCFYDADDAFYAAINREEAEYHDLLDELLACEARLRKLEDTSFGETCEMSALKERINSIYEIPEFSFRPLPHSADWDEIPF